MQRKLPLIAPMQGAPADAPAALLRMIGSESEAVAVSLAAAGAKLAFIAASLGVSESLASLYRSGKRRIPDRRVASFCYATGTNLLRQYRELQEALQEVVGKPDRRLRIERMARELRAA